MFNGNIYPKGATMDTERLTAEQLERLTDKLTRPYDDPEQGEALILLMDEIERVLLSNPLFVESITVTVKNHAFYRSQNLTRNREKLIDQLRSRL